MRIVYGAKEFESGLNIIFYVFNIDGTMFGTYTAIEVSNIGVYHNDIPLINREEYIIGISEPDSVNWKAFKYVSTY